MFGGGQMYAFKLSGADLAEAYRTHDATIGAGDIVRVDGSLKAGVQKTAGAYDSAALGIISTAPWLILGDTDAMEGRPVLLALSGRVPVKVSLENGPIKAGDYLTTSSIPGVAMRATQPGQMIGKALADFTGSGTAGTVMTFVNLTWADPGNSVTAPNVPLQATNMRAGTLNVSGGATMDTLTVTGSASIATLQVGTLRAETLTVTGSATIGGDLNLQGVGMSRNAITKRFKASKPILAGSAVVLDTQHDGQVTTSTIEADTHVIGVAVTAAQAAGDEVVVAIGGSVQARVVPGATLGGGDLVVTASAEGAVQHAASPGAGSLLGKALGKPSDDLVWLLISLQ